MSYVDEVIELVVKKNPAEPEFHQAVKEVLESLRVVIEANEAKFRKEPVTEQMIREEICQVEQTGLECYKYGFFSRSGFACEGAGNCKLIELRELYK